MIFMQVASVRLSGIDTFSQAPEKIADSYEANRRFRAIFRVDRAPQKTRQGGEETAASLRSG